MKNSQKGFVVPLLIIIAVLAIGGSGYYFTNKSDPISDNRQGDILPPMTQNELLKYKLANGTTEEKEKILTDLNSMLDKFKVATIPVGEQTDIASITPLIPSVIEAILDDTSLPRHGDTGWGNVYHFAATIMSKFAYKIDGVQRSKDPKFGFFDSVGTADKVAQKVVYDNWLGWWDDNEAMVKVTTVVSSNIVNWKTYINEKYGYEVKYPPILVGAGSGSFANPLAINTSGSGIAFSIANGNFLEAKGNSYLENKGTITIDGYKAEKYYRPLYVNSTTTGAIIYIVPEKNISILYYPYSAINHKISESDMNQILSTFKFTK